MWALAVLLWVAVVPGPAAADCELSIQLNGTSGGGQTLLLSAERNHSCPCACARLELTYQPCARGDAPCVTDWSDALTTEPTTEPTLAGCRARATVFLAGWYRVRCCNAGGACNRVPVAETWVDGLNYTTWNVSVSALQIAGDLPQLSVEVTGQMDPSTELPFYLPRLWVQLVNATNQHLVETGSIVIPENNSFVFGRDKGLRPGLYHIKVRPRNVQCGRYSCKARYVSHMVTASERPSELPSVGQDTAASRTVYVVLGVLAGMTLLCLVGFLSYSFLCGRRGRRWLERVNTVPQKSPLPSSPAPTVPVSVMLLHRGGGGAALDQLRAALRSAGIVLLDARERSVLNLMQTYPSPAELLALEAFRDARLLFVGGGGDGTAGSVPARVYDSMLKFVRNGRLGLDYGRVYAATLGEVAGDELAGLVEGRLFRVPADVPALMEHILCARRLPLARLYSTESQTDLLPAMEQSTDPSAQPSPV